MLAQPGTARSVTPPHGSALAAPQPIIWLLRAAMAVAVVVALLRGDQPAALLSVGLLLVACGTRIPRLARRLPGWVELCAVLALALPGVSTGLGLYGAIWQWGKLVHAVDAGLFALVCGGLVLAYRDARRVDLSDELSTLLAMFAGVLFGVTWETIEFLFDWVTASSLQKSNADTMTDFLWNDIAVAIGAVAIVHVYCHGLTVMQRTQLGELATWLANGPSRLLDRHGLRLILLAAAVIIAALAALWFTGRDLPLFGAS